MPKRKSNKFITLAMLNLPNALRDYLERIGAEPVNHRAFIVKQPLDDTGRGSYYRESAYIWIRDKQINFVSKGDDSLRFTTEEKKAIDESLAALKDFSSSVMTDEGDAERQRKALGVDPENWYVLLDLGRKNVIMCQHRIDNDDGTKNYISWTKFGNVWKPLSPDGGMPFWKPNKQFSKLVMIHEGCKASRWVDWMCRSDNAAAKEERKKHPWYDFLKDFEHWGITGGALAPQYADYRELKAYKPTEVIYSCDRDLDGESAVQVVSKMYGDLMHCIRYGEHFKYSWDMRDPLPEEYFIDGQYTGPAIEDLIRPATYATRTIYVGPTRKAKHELNRAFRGQWYHIIEPDAYVYVRTPHKLYNEKQFNDICKPYSNVEDLARIFKDYYEVKVDGVIFNPGRKGGINEGPPLTFNMYSAPSLKPKKGDASPFLNFLEGLFPIESDRIEVIRWCATLSERPAIKMKYNILMCSEMQGVGKSTLCDIMGKLVGRYNVRYPSEHLIAKADFTSWKQCRLAICNEIYAGQSSSVYNSLKDLATDKIVNINTKKIVDYDIENFCHVMACSNSMRALKIPDEDRRWLIPNVGEKQRSKEYWNKFHSWLNTGGHAIIKWWFVEWLKTNNAVGEGDHAPPTVAKITMIEEGFSSGQKLVADALSSLKEYANGNPFLTTDITLQELITERLHNGKTSPFLEKPNTVRSVAKGSGWGISPKRTRIANVRGQCHIVSTCHETVSQPIEEIRARGIEIITSAQKLIKILGWDKAM